MVSLTFWLVLMDFYFSFSFCVLYVLLLHEVRFYLNEKMWVFALFLLFTLQLFLEFPYFRFITAWLGHSLLLYIQTFYFLHGSFYSTLIAITWIKQHYYYRSFYMWSDLICKVINVLMFTYSGHVICDGYFNSFYACDLSLTYRLRPFLAKKLEILIKDFYLTFILNLWGEFIDDSVNDSCVAEEIQ